MPQTRDNSNATAGEGVVKPWYIHMMVYYSAHADICSHTDQSQEHHARRKKSNSKGYILHDSIHMAILEKVKPQGQKSVSGCLSGRDTGEGRKKTIKEHE